MRRAAARAPAPQHAKAESAEEQGRPCGRFRGPGSHGAPAGLALEHLAARRWICRIPAVPGASRRIRRAALARIGIAGAARAVVVSGRPIGRTARTVPGLTTGAAFTDRRRRAADTLAGFAGARVLARLAIGFARIAARPGQRIAGSGDVAFVE